MTAALLAPIQLGANEAYRRQVGFEWEPITDAISYEVELSMGTDKTFQFKTKDPKWSGKLVPGSYLMRLRSVDKRGIAGSWSKTETFNVLLEKPQILSPKIDVKTDSDTKSKVVFEWKTTSGASQYTVEVINEAGKTVEKKVASQNKLILDLEVAQKYKWTLTAENEKGVKAETTDSAQFALIGKKISPPNIDQPEGLYVRSLSWSKPELAEGYEVVIERNQKGKWIQVIEKKDLTFNTIDIPIEWPGGNYSAKVRSIAKLRKPSDWNKIKFDILVGDRSPASEEIATIRQSIDRTVGYYFTATYLITIMKYMGQHSETNTRSTFNAFGGTGRIGLGYLSDKTNWGFAGTLDLSGFLVAKQLVKFAAMEIQRTYSLQTGQRGELRLGGGLYYKELPETIAVGTAGSYTMNNVKALGPHFGFEYLISITPKIGMQLNGRYYYSLIGLSTPNGQAMTPQPSMQYGIMGSYRYRTNLTGLVGYAYRIDRSAYKALAGDANDPNSTSLADPGSMNKSEISGHYINFLLEWDI